MRDAPAASVDSHVPAMRQSVAVMTSFQLGDPSAGQGPTQSHPGNPMHDVPKWARGSVMQAAQEYALRDDWSCVVSPPPMNQQLPGFRYGASMPTRPQVVVLPCPCAGGEWQKPHEYTDAVLRADGSWAPRRGVGTNHSLGMEEGFTHMPPPTQDSLARRGLGHAISQYLKGRAEIGTEYYAADYRCAQGYKKKPFLVPGKRWWYQPEYAVIPVATPCPCALGVWTGMQVEKPRKATPLKIDADEFGVHWDSHVPSWQRPKHNGDEFLDGLPDGGDSEAIVLIALAVASALKQRSVPADGKPVKRQGATRRRGRRVLEALHGERQHGAAHGGGIPSEVALFL